MSKGNCPYYPCSKFGTNCKHCYCLFYPCKNLNTGGKFITTKDGFKLWDCTDCRYIHQDYVVNELNIDKNESNPFVKLDAWIKLLRIIDVETAKE